MFSAFGGEHDASGVTSALFPERFPGDEPEPLGDTRIAASARFLGEVGRFDDELAERVRMLPGIVRTSGASNDDNDDDDGAVAEARWRGGARWRAGLTPSYSAI